ncbi:diacylglycerol O-acyltransferase [Emydomyces testavorans]|uniref:diacylglycerol O-acyltransferase n=1 Tax=Emydomyces testavorans TaxID=2070801 RepID=A0AAF0DG05_9EURO|nr:diacylglycerol O-acyltransferase [Emydomyces testavorans]
MAGFATSSASTPPMPPSRSGTFSTPPTSSEEESSQISASSPEELVKATPEQKRRSKYRHVAAYHSQIRPSCLSRESNVSPSFFGFRNLMVLVLTQQVKGAIGRMKKAEDRGDDREGQEQFAFRLAWFYIAVAHTVNASLCLSVTSYAVYFYINHPGIGTLCEMHAIVVWLKNCSYAFTNRDLRHALLHPSPDNNLPKIYNSCPYPHNVTIKNLTYFWLAPTLVYQPVYPRTSHIRWNFVAKRVAEFCGLSVFMWIISAQYASPTLLNALEKIALRDWASITERVMKLSTISLVIWLAGFYALFQSFLNALAEVIKFGDREFYTDWWNSPSVGRYWRTWNIPVYQFMKRHIFSPLIGRGWSPFTASLTVFTFSAVLHELAVGIPTHNIIGVAFGGMMLQLPLIAVTLPLEKMSSPAGKVMGNALFWLSFCLVGQPLAALLYFFAWQAKYGSISKVVNK